MTEGIWEVHQRIDRDRFEGIFLSPQDFWRYLLDHAHISTYYPVDKDSVILEFPDSDHLDWCVISALKDFRIDLGYDGWTEQHYAGDILFTIKRVSPIRWPS